MKFHTSLLCLLALPVFQASAIDLTPRWTDTTIDGIPQRRLYFADGSQKILLSIDKETEVAGRFGGTNFKFPKFPDIDLIVVPSTFTPSDAFDETKLVGYREAAKKLVPARAHGVEISEEKRDPLPINHWKGFLVHLKYTMDSRSYFQTVTFLNLNERDQIVIVTSAPEREWSEAGERSWQIVRSWQEMLPGDEGPGRGN